MKCDHCQAEVTNGLSLCENCQQTLSIALVNVAAFHKDVLRIQPGERVKVRGAYQSTPPPAIEPAHDRISAAADYVSAVVFGWVQNLEDDRPGIPSGPLDTSARCGWLESYRVTIATLGWGAEILREMLECEQMLQRILDKADTGWYAGICGNEIGRETDERGNVTTLDCPRNLYGTQSASYVRCPECGRQWQTKERRDTMMREAREEVAPVRVIARIVVGLMDGEVSVERLTRRIEKWIDNGTLKDLGTRVLDGRPRKVYRLGEVFDLVNKPKKAAA